MMDIAKFEMFRNFTISNNALLFLIESEILLEIGFIEEIRTT